MRRSSGCLTPPVCLKAPNARTSPISRAARSAEAQDVEPLRFYRLTERFFNQKGRTNRDEWEKRFPCIIDAKVTRADDERVTEMGRWCVENLGPGYARKREPFRRYFEEERLFKVCRSSQKGAVWGARYRWYRDEEEGFVWFMFRDERDATLFKMFWG
jgi:hypothetical protein